MNNKLINRDPKILNLLTYSGSKILSPQNIAISIGIMSLDIGSLCFKETKKKNNKGKYLYNPDSLVKSRIIIIRKLIQYSIFLVDDLSYNSLYSRMINIFNFLFWCNSKDLFGQMNYNNARFALEEYVSYLKEKVRLGLLSNNSAQRYQYDTIHGLKDGLELDSIEVGINLIKKSKHSIRHTEAPCEVEQGKVISIANSVFSTLTDAIFEKKTFPLPIPVPSYLKRKNNVAWYFPINKWTAVNNNNKKHKYYDYINGYIRDLTPEENLIPIERFNHKNLSAFIQEANLYKNKHWLSMAYIASKAFAILFIANTGMNNQQMINILWSDDYVITRNSQEFIGIKYRADNKEVKFIITANFLATFKKYIALRKKIIDTTSNFNFLFFSFNKKLINPINKPNPSLLNSAIRALRLIDPKLPNIKSIKWRAAKANQLLSTTDIHTTAELLQNDVKTIKESYLEGNTKKTEVEMSNFLDNLSSKLINVRPKESLESVSIGNCKNYGNPKYEMNTSNSIQLDCKKSEGCLFCENYIVHADEIDIRKLLSCKYCIKSTSNFSSSIEHFNTLYTDILERIDYLLKSIEKISKKHFDLVHKIQKEVFEKEYFDSYWESKIEQLIELGLI